jgi:hypothetical protein
MSQEAFIPVGWVMYSPDGEQCQCEEHQVEQLKAAGFTTVPPEVAEDALSEIDPDTASPALADTKAAHSDAVNANIAAQQAAAAE